MSEIINTCGDWIENKQLIRRLAFFVMFGMTIYTLLWSMQFAQSSARPGMDIAAILAAIWTPLSALQGYVFAMYNNARAQA